MKLRSGIKLFKEHYNLFSYFFIRDIKNRYLGNITGFSWLLIQPIITLTIYWFVFGVIFTQRFEDVSFIVYLVIGFWPWLAFSEALLKSITVIDENKELIGKVSLDYRIPVIASISSVFVLNIIGYIIVLLSLALFGEKFNYGSILLIIIPVFSMYLFAIGLGMIFSILQVFVKDVLQFVTTGITLWFFLTPILYSESVLPEKYRSLIHLNPIYTPINFIHKALIGKVEPLPWLYMMIFIAFSIILIYLSFKLYDRLNLYFVDYI